MNQERTTTRLGALLTAVHIKMQDVSEDAPMDSVTAVTSETQTKSVNMRGGEAMNDDVSAVITAAHRAYCRDTGCFDGDDISHPGLAQAIRLSNAQAVVSVLEQLPCDAMPELYSMCLTRDPDHRWQWCDNCSALAVWKAEVARLQGGHTLEDA